MIIRRSNKVSLGLFWKYLHTLLLNVKSSCECALGGGGGGGGGGGVHFIKKVQYVIDPFHVLCDRSVTSVSHTIN